MECVAASITASSTTISMCLNPCSNGMGGGRLIFNAIIMWVSKEGLP